MISYTTRVEIAPHPHKKPTNVPTYSFMSVLYCNVHQAERGGGSTRDHAELNARDHRLDFPTQMCPLYRLKPTSLTVISYTTRLEIAPFLPPPLLPPSPPPPELLSAQLKAFKQAPNPVVRGSSKWSNVGRCS